MVSFFIKVAGLRHPVVLNYKKAVLKSFAKSTGKHLCQSIFLNKVAALRPAALFKIGTLTQLFSCEFCEILNNTFFTKHIRVFKLYKWVILQIIFVEDKTIVLYRQQNTENLQFIYAIEELGFKIWYFLLPFHDGGRYHIETSPLICGTNQWTCFYMITASVMKGLNCF